MEKVININDLKSFAEEVLFGLQSSDKATVVGLYGNLGAGKTTFTQQLAKVLGVRDNVLSPTFVVMKIYDLIGQKWKRLVHIDAYRIEESQELLILGFNDLISNKDNLIIIEWPEKIADIIPEHNKIKFEVVDEQTRKINYD